jgi:hypothetical protein
MAARNHILRLRQAIQLLHRADTRLKLMHTRDGAKYFVLPRGGHVDARAENPGASRRSIVTDYSLSIRNSGAFADNRTGRMPATEEETMSDRMTTEEFLANRIEAGRRIDPNSANVEFTFQWAEVLDPYGVLDLTPEERCSGRSYIARSPDSDGWVSFYDLPDKTRDELWRRINSGELVDSFEKRFLDWL